MEGRYHSFGVRDHSLEGRYQSSEGRYHSLEGRYHSLEGRYQTKKEGNNVSPGAEGRGPDNVLGKEFVKMEVVQI